MKNVTLIVICCFYSFAFSQKNETDEFKRISESVKNFEVDTTAVPDDKLSEKISEFRKLRGGFNIQAAMDYKIDEAREKNELSQTEYEDLKKFIDEGDGYKWMNNAVIWMYRKNFTVRDMNKLIKFYKSTTGKKMATQFPIVMLQSAKAAEIISEKYKQMRGQ